WYYSGDMLTVECRTDPARVAELLPDGVEPAHDDPGAVAVIWADWQSCGPDFSELMDPARAQYKEVLVVVRCRWGGRTWSRCVYIWVDKDFALARGHLQGYPKVLGDIWMTRPVPYGRAGPRLAPGGRFGATCSAYGQRLLEAHFTIEAEAESAGFVNGHPMLHSRWMPRIEIDGSDSLDELVTMRGHDVEVGPCYSGTAELHLHPAAFEEVSRLEPIEMIGGYYRQVANTWSGGTTLEAR
ncbi:MAG: acetoacetate decarboxylase family protein, partial [Acidimicrobiales bacterium]